MEGVQLVDVGGLAISVAEMRRQMGNALRIERGIAPCFRIVKLAIVYQQVRGKGEPVKATMHLSTDGKPVARGQVRYQDVVRDISLTYETDRAGVALFPLTPLWRYAQTDKDIHPTVWPVDDNGDPDGDILHGAARIWVVDGFDKALDVWWEWDEGETPEPGPGPDVVAIAARLDILRELSQKVEADANWLSYQLEELAGLLRE